VKEVAAEDSVDLAAEAAAFPQVPRHQECSSAHGARSPTPFIGILSGISLYLWRKNYGM
jgi:hypothetical protein